MVNLREGLSQSCTHIRFRSAPGSNVDIARLRSLSIRARNNSVSRCIFSSFWSYAAKKKRVLIQTGPIKKTDLLSYQATCPIPMHLSLILLTWIRWLTCKTIDPVNCSPLMYACLLMTISNLLILGIAYNCSKHTRTQTSVRCDHVLTPSYINS